jgi:myo-inositol-1(or 4)-monophosphatase
MTATYLAVAAEAARRAGQLQRERLWTDHDIRYKGEIDLVTEVDQASEELIVAAIRAAFPDHDILAEEQTRETGTSRYRWIVDPLGRYHQLCPRLSVVLRLHCP